MTVSEASALTLHKVKWANLASVEGWLINDYEKCFRMKIVATVKATLFTLLLWYKISDCEQSESASFAQGELIHFNKR